MPQTITLSIPLLGGQTNYNIVISDDSLSEFLERIVSYNDETVYYEDDIVIM